MEERGQGGRWGLGPPLLTCAAIRISVCSGRPGRPGSRPQSPGPSVKGADGLDTASRAPRRPESTWVRAPPEGPGGLLTLHWRNRGWRAWPWAGGHGARTERPCAHAFLQPSPQISRTSWKTGRTSRAPAPNTGVAGGRQRSDSLGAGSPTPASPHWFNAVMRLVRRAFWEE